jgi:cell division protein FtsL
VNGEGRGAALAAKGIDNSQIVREVDPRVSRDLLSLLALVAVLVSGLVLYAWPHLQLRQLSRDTELMTRERERLLEENRKLRLMKSVLEDLRRVERIALRDLGMTRPAPERLIVVEQPEPVAEGAQLASGEAAPSRAGAKN